MASEDILIDDGNVSAQLTKLGKPFDKVLELVGTVSLEDSLGCVGDGGIVCMTGIVGNAWNMKKTNPMEYIPTAHLLTVYSGGNEDLVGMPWGDILKQVADGTLSVQIGRVFKIDQIVEAHELMEANKARGKIVVVT